MNKCLGRIRARASLVPRKGRSVLGSSAMLCNEIDSKVQGVLEPDGSGTVTFIFSVGRGSPQSPHSLLWYSEGFITT